MLHRTPSGFVVLLLSATTIHAQTTHQKAPKAIADILHAPTQPHALFNPMRDHLELIDMAVNPRRCGLERWHISDSERTDVPGEQGQWRAGAPRDATERSA
jgi:hypothetical protein